jgi:hypothetical protein
MSTNKKGLERNPDLRKTDLTSGRELLSSPNITESYITVNNSDLTSPQYIIICWLCGSDKNVRTYHAAGGILGACDRCNSGGQP